MNRDLRLKILKKMAQADLGTIPTDQAVQSKPAPPPPPSFQASSAYPGIRYGFNQASVAIIDNLASLLNMAAHYSSAGAINFQTFRNDNFNFDASGVPSVDQRNIMNLSKKVYHTLLNNGQEFARPLTAQQVAEMADIVLESPELNNLSHVSPTGQLALKIQGNLKTLITNYLTYLKLANPKTPQ